MKKDRMEFEKRYNRGETEPVRETALPRLSQAGDVNNDNNINIIAALITAQYYVGLNPALFVTTNADVNGNGAAAGLERKCYLVIPLQQQQLSDAS